MFGVFIFSFRVLACTSCRVFARFVVARVRKWVFYVCVCGFAFPSAYEFVCRCWHHTVLYYLPLVGYAFLLLLLCMKSYRHQKHYTPSLHALPFLLACVSLSRPVRVRPRLSVFLRVCKAALLTDRCRFRLSLRPQQLQMISRELSGLTSLILDSCDVGDVGVRSLSSMTQLEVRHLPPRAKGCELAGLHGQLVIAAVTFRRRFISYLVYSLGLMGLPAAISRRPPPGLLPRR